MRTLIKVLSFQFFLLLLLFSPIRAEKLSLKVSLNTNSIAHEDINNWIDSYNSLWTDWQTLHGGQLEGEFLPLKYGSSYEVEVRIPVVYGFGLLFGGTQISSQASGRIAYDTSAGNQREVQAISNRIEALPLKIGLCYRIELIPRLSLTASVGRHIVFVKYQTEEDYEAVFISQGQNFSYWYEKDITFNSEALGLFASVGAEFELFKFLAVVLEAEQTLNSVDGFKGSYSMNNYLGQEEKGKASLYYYESKEFGLDNFYPVLTGHKEKPEGVNVRNVRQGELNFDGISAKIGIRLKF